LKKTVIWILLSVIGLIVILIFFYRWFVMRVNSDFATEALLEYHYSNKDISIVITDEDNMQTLKEILKGIPHMDYPSCGFSNNVSITMTNGNKRIVFCPANDTCPLLRINSSDRYIDITEDDKIRLYGVLEKYGMTFPCI